MRPTYIILLLTATLTASYRIPKGALDGNYKVYRDENGVEVHEPPTLEDIIPVNGNEEQHLDIRDLDGAVEPALRKRRPPYALDPSRQTWCGCGISM